MAVGAVVPFLAVWFLAVTEGGPSVESWFERGVLGAVVAGFVFRQIVPGGTYKEEREERLQQQKVFEEKVLPALVGYGEFVREQLRRAGQ